jgi:hypothetical protein
MIRINFMTHMTDSELSKWVQKARRRSVATGLMPELWDLIYNVEALLEGERTLAGGREEIEKMVREDMNRMGEP